MTRTRGRPWPQGVRKNFVLQKFGLMFRSINSLQNPLKTNSGMLHGKANLTFFGSVRWNSSWSAVRSQESCFCSDLSALLQFAYRCVVHVMYRVHLCSTLICGQVLKMYSYLKKKSQKPQPPLLLKKVLQYTSILCCCTSAPIHSHETIRMLHVYHHVWRGTRGPQPEPSWLAGKCCETRLEPPKHFFLAETHERPKGK